MRHYNDARQIPRIAAIHDLSCFGRSALTAVIPILSVMGAQVIPIPTALLSTHTGGFDGLYFRDLSRDMSAIISHFEQLDLKFDAIYSGFLGSAEQIDLVSAFIDRFGKDIPVLVDPVMGDGGRPYQTYTPELIAGMRRLCHKSGIITPNLTEACFLTEREIPASEPADEFEAAELAESLIEQLRAAYGDINIVITGIGFGDRIGNACALSQKDQQMSANAVTRREQDGNECSGGSGDGNDNKCGGGSGDGNGDERDDEDGGGNCGGSGNEGGDCPSVRAHEIHGKKGGCHIISTPRYPRSFPGTGEIFSSTLLGSLLTGADLLDAVKKAISFTCHTISASQSSPHDSATESSLRPALGS